MRAYKACASAPTSTRKNGTPLSKSTAPCSMRWKSATAKPCAPCCSSICVRNSIPGVRTASCACRWRVRRSQHRHRKASMSASDSSKILLSAQMQRRAAGQGIASRLAAETGGEVLFDKGSRGRYATDASIYQIEPIGVFLPRTEEDAALAIDIARDLGAPILPRGGGTSQCGQTVGEALVIDNSKYLNKVLHRVGGYNIDIYYPQSERPYTGVGSVNLSHLLVGSEGTLAYMRRLTLKLAPLPRHKPLGVINFPTFYQAMDSARHIVKLLPAAVELVDRTMIDLARDNPAFRPVIEKALIGEPDAILLVEFAGESADEQTRKLKSLAELMGDLELAGSVVEMTEAAAQKELRVVRRAGLNIMMRMRGDGKPVSFIEDCAVPLEHLAEYTSRLTEVFHKHGTRGTWYAHASVGTLHVRPILDMRRGGAEKMRAIAEAAGALVRQYKGAFSGEHGDGLVRSEWVAWQFGPRLFRAFEEIKDLFDPHGLMNPG